MHIHILLHICIHAHTHTHRSLCVCVCANLEFGLKGYPGRGREAEEQASRRGKQGEEETVVKHLKALALEHRCGQEEFFNAATN